MHLWGIFFNFQKTYLFSTTKWAPYWTLRIAAKHRTHRAILGKHSSLKQRNESVDTLLQDNGSYRKRLFVSNQVLISGKVSVSCSENFHHIKMANNELSPWNGLFLLHFSDLDISCSAFVNVMNCVGFGCSVPILQAVNNDKTSFTALFLPVSRQICTPHPRWM